MIDLEFEALFTTAVNCYLYCPLHCFSSPLNHFSPLFNDIAAVPELQKTFLLPLTDDPIYSEKRYEQIRLNYRAKIRRIMALQTIKTNLHTNRTPYVLVADVYADFYLISSNCRLFTKEAKENNSFLKYADDLEEKVSMFMIKTVQAYALRQYEQLLTHSKTCSDALPIEDAFNISLKMVFSDPGLTQTPSIRSHILSISDPDIPTILAMDVASLRENETVAKVLADVKESCKQFYPLTSTYREPGEHHLFLLSVALQSMPREGYKNLMTHATKLLAAKAVPCNLSELDLSDLSYKDFWVFFARALEHAQSHYLSDLVSTVDKHSSRV